VSSQRVPRGEAVLLGDGALGIPETAKLRLTPKQFLRLTLELIEVGTRGQGASSHTDLLPKLA
jgi:hypothetical protein